MATLPITADEPQTPHGKLETLTLEEILTPNANLAEFLDDSVLNGIGQKVIRDVDIDEESRKDWLGRYRKWMDMAMQVREQKNFPWPKACYSLDTDILTDRGWLPIGEVTVGDQVLSRAPDGRAAFYPVTKTFRHRAPWLVEFKGKGVDLRVTPNHKMLVENKAGDKQELIEASEFLTDRRGLTARYIPLTSAVDGERPKTIYGIDAAAYVRLLGWYVSEGSCIVSKSRYVSKRHGDEREYELNGSFSIAQSKRANPKNYQQIIDDLKACGFTYKEYDRAIIVHARSMPAMLKAELRALGKVYDKHLPAHVMKLAPELQEQLLETMIAGDGNIRRRPNRIDNVTYFTTSRLLADQVQEIAQRVGRRATLTVVEARLGGVINGRQITGAAEGYTLRILEKTRVQVSKLSRRPVPHNDDVACVEVDPHHTVYVRRNGIPVWCGNSNVKFPLLTVAAIQFQATAYPAIVDGSNLVKGRVMGPDPDGQKRQRADRIGDHMTWQLMYRMPDWEEETDKLLLMLPIAGCVFRKTYYDSVANTNCSEMVSGEDFVVNYMAKNLERAPRYTHRLKFYPHEVKEKIAAGLWVEVPISPTAEGSSDEDALIEFYEQHRYLDLDGDNAPEPYIVTTTKDGHVARLVPCFGAEDVTVATANGAMKAADAGSQGVQPNHVVSIERRQYFTKYAFIPAPDGSFYDIGFGWLLEDIGEPVNVAINQMLDAGTVQNAGGGFLGSGINIRGGNMPFRVGEWKRVEVTNNSPLADNIFRLDHPGPSAVLFQLLGMMIDAARQITSVQGVVTGENPPPNQPATTTMALIEQGHKVLTGIIKRIYRAFGKELRVLFHLNGEYLDDEEYFPVDQGGTDMKSVERADYNDKNIGVIPVADPNVITDMQKLARSEAEWSSFNGDPLINQLELRRNRMAALGTPDPETMLQVPPPPPNPELLLKGAEEARKKLDSEAKYVQAFASAADLLSDAVSKLYAAGLVTDAAALAATITELGGTIHGDLGGGAIPAVEGQPANAGVPGPAPAAPQGPDGGMGPGPAPDAGAAGAGGPVGPVGGSQA